MYTGRLTPMRSKCTSELSISMRIALSVSFLFSCFSLPAQTTFPDSIHDDGIYRHYILYIPATYSASENHPLVFVLHGGGGTAEFMVNYTGFNAVSDTGNFIVVYPQGISTGLNFRGLLGHHWADGRTTTPPDTMGVDDVGFISALIDSLAEEYSIDRKKVFATGVSNGGYMVQRLACQLSQKIAAVATVAATFPDSLMPHCNPNEPISILIMNGTADNFVPTYTGGSMDGVGFGGYVLSTYEMIDLWMELNNCSGSVDSVDLPNEVILDFSRVTKYTYGDCSDETEIVLYKVINGGHTQPGELTHVPLTGVANRDINGSSEIWIFFKAHSKKVTVRIEDLTSNGIENKLSIYPNPTKG